MSFLNPIYFLWSFLIVPIIILHLLKKEYKKTKVSSLFLWDETLKNIQVDKSFQRIKKWLLLILQILIIISLIMFLVKPYIKGEQTKNIAYILVDNSMSMEENINDTKKDVIDLVSDLSDDTLINLYSYNSEERLIKSSFSKKEINTSIEDEIELSVGSNDLEFVLDKNDFSDGNIYIFTDAHISLKDENIFYKVYENTEDDVFIENINYKIKENNDVDLAIRINNISFNKRNMNLSLYSNGEISHVKEINIEKKSVKTYFFKDIKDLKYGKVEIDSDDKIKLNNIRYFAINDEKKNKVLLISDNNLFLEKALSNKENIELYKTSDKIEKLEGYDLYVLDSVENKLDIDSGNILAFNSEITELFKFNERNIKGDLKVVSDDLFKYLKENFYINKANSYFESDHHKLIAFFNEKPIAVKGIKENIRYIALGFDIYESDFPVKPDFPVFMNQALDFLLKDNISFKSNILIDDTINLKEKYKITKPSGSKVLKSLKVKENGVYLLEDKDNLYYLSSNINPNEFTKSTEVIDSEIKNTIRVKEEKKDISKIFLILALIFLLIEWLVYKYEK